MDECSVCVCTRISYPAIFIGVKLLDLSLNHCDIGYFEIIIAGKRKTEFPNNKMYNNCLENIEPYEKII